MADMTENQTDNAAQKKPAKKYDVLLPPGVPRSIIMDVTEKFDVELVERPREMKFANMDGDIRNLLAFRTDLETAQKVEKYIFDELKKYIGDE